MRKFFSALFKKISEMLEKSSPQIERVEEENVVIEEVLPPKIKEKQEKPLPKKKTEMISYSESSIRDVIDLMEFPFLALSKDRINPIIYESADKTKKVVISGHRGHFLASIYDWDIILVVAGKIQEILNKSEIPSHNVIIPRHELLKTLHKQGGKKEQKDLEKSLQRLQLTGITTTVNNQDYRHKAGFGFIDSWGYLERKNNREIRNVKITLSPWLYELCCAKGNLLKSHRDYFELTSGLKRFLYRTARKHAGNNKEGWEFSVDQLYEKSGSEGNFRKFKYKLKATVKDNNIPEYSMEWIEKNRIPFVTFKRSKIHELDKLAEEYEKKQEKTILIQ